MHSLWHLITRFGEAQLLVPMAVLVGVWLARERAGWPMAVWWGGLTAAAVALTTASKVAFIGWGIGSTVLDFTGISGHAMFAAAVLPLLLRSSVPASPPLLPPLAGAVGHGLAALIALSRVIVGAHSASEALAGFALGTLAGSLPLLFAHAPSRRVPMWLPVALVAWMVAVPTQTVPLNTHGMVTRLALSLSGRAHPYTRSDLQRRRQKEMLGTVASS